ncbi:hypothetical protein FDENT_8109 [Fusarium denticulatum]|uniref:Uncharacterized protein n=1 Tax=Fusarium denticulatum TaxID=48507 RepID=A0A8H5U2H4_9HYPO|nr:hypothetical protein FDENT_8109 [Fusarium denticulatum]
MATAGPSKYRFVTDQARLAQNSHLADSARQSSPHRIRLRSPSTCQSPTGIPKPSLEPPSRHRRYSRTSSVSSSKSSSGPSRSRSADSSPVSSVQEVSITEAEAKESAPELPKAPEHFTRAFSIPKTLFEIYETSQEWHFGLAPMQNVQALGTELNQANFERQKAEQQVRDLTQRLSSVAEPGLKIHSSESDRKCSEVARVTPSKLRKERDARLMELIENKGNMPLEERFEELVGWSQRVEADIDAAQDRNTFLDDLLGKAGRDKSKLQGETLLLKANKEKLEKQLEQTRKLTTMAHNDQTAAAPSAKPLRSLASQNDQENRLAELQRENERPRQENNEMRNALKQPQSQDSPEEEPESQLKDATPEEAQESREERFDRELDACVVQKASVQGSSSQTEASKGKEIACRTTVAHNDQRSMTLGIWPPQPLASNISQENSIARLQWENERLRKENQRLRNALEQHQNENSRPEGPETQHSNVSSEEAQVRNADPRAEIQDTDVEMGGVTAGQDSAAQLNIEAPVVPTIPPETSEAGEILRFNLQRFLSSINRDPISSSDDAGRRRDSRRHERRRQLERWRLEQEEEARQQQRERSDREEDARRDQQRRLRRERETQRTCKHHKQSLKTMRTILKEFPDQDVVPHPFRSRIGSFKTPQGNTLISVAAAKCLAIYSNDPIITLDVFCDAPSR